MIDLVSAYPIQENYAGEQDISDTLLSWMAWDVMFMSAMAESYPFGI